LAAITEADTDVAGIGEVDVDSRRTAAATRVDGEYGGEVAATTEGPGILVGSSVGSAGVPSGTANAAAAAGTVAGGSCGRGGAGGETSCTPAGVGAAAVEATGGTRMAIAAGAGAPANPPNVATQVVGSVGAEGAAAAGVGEASSDGATGGVRTAVVAEMLCEDGIRESGLAIMSGGAVAMGLVDEGGELLGVTLVRGGVDGAAAQVES